MIFLRGKYGAASPFRGRAAAWALAAAWAYCLAASGAELAAGAPYSSGGRLAVPVHLYAGGGEEVAGLQFDLGFDPSVYAVAEVTLGEGAAAAGKQPMLSDVHNGTARVIVTGFNQEVIPDGLVAVVYLDALGGSTGQAVRLEGVLASDPFAYPVEMAVRQPGQPSMDADASLDAPGEPSKSIEPPLAPASVPGESSPFSGGFGGGLPAPDEFPAANRGDHGRGTAAPAAQRQMTSSLNAVLPGSTPVQSLIQLGKRTLPVTRVTMSRAAPGTDTVPATSPRETDPVTPGGLSAAAGSAALIRGAVNQRAAAGIQRPGANRIAAASIAESALRSPRGPTLVPGLVALAVDAALLALIFLSRMYVFTAWVKARTRSSADA